MLTGQWAFEETFYCLLIGGAKSREKADFANIAQIFERSNLNCSFEGEKFIIFHFLL